MLQNIVTICFIKFCPNLTLFTEKLLPSQDLYLYLVLDMFLIKVDREILNYDHSTTSSIPFPRLNIFSAKSFKVKFCLDEFYLRILQFRFHSNCLYKPSVNLDVTLDKFRVFETPMRMLKVAKDRSSKLAGQIDGWGEQTFETVNGCQLSRVEDLASLKLYALTCPVER